MTETSISSMRLWQLISPALPVGAYSYSQGLEYAIEAGWVTSEQSAIDWILGQIKNNLSMLDVPIFFRLYDAWNKSDLNKVDQWNDVLLASRESAELKKEDNNLGAALLRVLKGLDLNTDSIKDQDMAFVTVYAFACQHWQIEKTEAANGLLWSWCENQVAAALKLVPLGQTSGQRIMFESAECILLAVKNAAQCCDEDIGLLAPGMAMSSALHETQYTRLFRS